MKFLLTFLLLSITAFSQENNNSTILKLENEISTPYSSINGFDFNNIQDVKKKSPGLAILYSLLLPGMGELYADSYSSGQYFTIAEGMLWVTYFGINSYGSWLKDRYTSFAQSNGGVNTGGKDADYFATISEYRNIDEYNDEKALERDFGSMFNRERFYWNWETDQQRKDYRSMWVSSEQAFNNLRFVVGALIVNRIVSAINAVRMVSAYNKRQSTEMGWNISLGIDNKPTLPSSYQLQFHTSF